VLGDKRGGGGEEPVATTGKSAWSSPERSKKERGRESPGLALLAGAHTDIWLEKEDPGTSLKRCPGKMFRQEN
jgi:hypothetical protein